MQPNIPQGPYVRYPSYKLRTPSIIDISLDKLMEHRMQEAQYNAQQQAVASRTPTVLTDPLLNFRVRDYYRAKYERSLQAEVAGKMTGSLEGAAIGAGIASTIMSAILLIGTILSPIPGDEVAAAAAVGGLAPITGLSTTINAGIIGETALLGAGIGGIAGTIGSDYSTWYATRDMFKNLWQRQSIGRGVLNTMSFVGNSMDLIGSSAVIKSTLYALIKEQDVLETIKATYGLTEQGRQDMDFSMIREELGIDLGGVGNFVFDMTGETLADIGNLSGIAKGITNRITNKQYVKLVTDNMKQLFSKTDDVLENKNIIKKIAKYVRENNVEDLRLLLQKNTNLNTDLAKLLEGGLIKTTEQNEKINSYLSRFIDSINDSAKTSTAYRLNDIFEATDFMDDFLTHILWRVGNPAVFVLSGAKDINKFMKKFVVSDKFFELNKIIFGNSAIGNTIENAANKHIQKQILKGVHNTFIRNILSDPNGDKTLKNAIREINIEELEVNGEKITKLNNDNIKSINNLLEQNNIKSIADLYNNKNGNVELENLWNQIEEKYTSIVKTNQDKMSELAKQILEKRIKLTNSTIKEDVKKQYLQELDDLQKEYLEIANNKDYSYAMYMTKVLEDPENFIKSNKQLSTLYQLKNKQKYFGKLSNEDIKNMNNIWKDIIQDSIDGKNTLAINVLNQILGDEDLLSIINKNMDSSVLKELDVLYDDTVKTLNKSIKKVSDEYYIKIYDELVNKLKELAKDDPEMLKRINEFSNTYNDVDTDIMEYYVEEVEKIHKKYFKTYRKLLKDPNNKYAVEFYHKHSMKDGVEIDAFKDLLDESTYKQLEQIYKVRNNYVSEINELNKFISFFGLSSKYQVKSILDLEEQPEELLLKLKGKLTKAKLQYKYKTKYKTELTYKDLIKFIQTTKYSDIEIDTPEILDLESQIKAYNKRASELNTVKDILGNNNKVLKITTYSPFKTNLSQAETIAKERESLLKAFSILSNSEDIQNIIYDVNSIPSDVLDKDFELSEFTKNITNVLEELYSVSVLSAREHRTLNNLIAKYLFGLDLIPDVDYLNNLEKEIDKAKELIKSTTVPDHLKKQVTEFINNIENILNEPEPEKALDKFFTEQFKHIKQSFNDLIENGKKINKDFLQDKITKLQKEIDKYITDIDNDELLPLEVKKILNEFSNDNITIEEFKETIKQFNNIIDKKLLEERIQKILTLKQELRPYIKIQEYIDQGEGVFDSINHFISDIKEVNIHKLIDQEIDNIGSLSFETIFNYNPDNYYKTVYSLNGESKFPKENVDAYGKINQNAYYNFRRLELMLHLAANQRPEIYDKYYKQLHSIMFSFSPELYNDPKALDEFIKNFESFKKSLQQDAIFINNFEQTGLKIKIDFSKPGSYKVIYNGSNNVKKLLQGIVDSIYTDSKDKYGDIIRRQFETEKLIEQIKTLTDEDLKDLAKNDSELYESLTNAGFNKDKPEEFVRKISSDYINNMFLDIYQRDKAFNSFIHRKKIAGVEAPLGNIIEKGRSFVVFDTETTGQTSNGLYQISAIRYTVDDNEELVESGRINYILNPNSVEAQAWTIDDGVDELYAYSNGGVKQGATKANWNKLYNDNTFVKVQSVKELTDNFTKFLQNDDILIAHNARFDFDQLINTINDNKFLDADGNIIQGLEEDFNAAKDAFNYDVLDSALIQNYTLAFGNPKDTTNLGLGLISDDVDVLKVYTTENGVRYFYNNVEINEQDIPPKWQQKQHLIELKYNLIDDTQEFSYDGGPLHVASNDINLMSNWLLKGLKNLHDSHITLDTLTNSRDIINKANSNILDNLLDDNTRRFINDIYDKASKKISSSGTDWFYSDIVDNIKTLLDDNKSFDERYLALQKIIDDVKNDDKLLPNFYENDIKEITIKILEKQKEKNLILNNQEYLYATRIVKRNSYNGYKSYIKPDILATYSKYTKKIRDIDNEIDLLNKKQSEYLDSNFFEDLDLKLENSFNDINVLKQLRSSEEMMYFQNNTAYVSFMNNNLFNNNSDVDNLIDLLSGNTDKLSDTNLKIYSEALQIIRKNNPDLYTNITQALDSLIKMKNNSAYYMYVLEDMDPRMYDIFDNIIKKIQYASKNGLDLSKKDSAEVIKFTSELNEYIHNRASKQNFDALSAQILMEDLLTNYDKLEMPTTKFINQLYHQLRDGIIGINNSIINERYNNLSINDIDNIVDNDYSNNKIDLVNVLESVNKELNNTFESMRTELSTVKNENKLLRLKTYTLKEFEEMSTFTEDEAKRLPKDFFDYTTGGEVKFDNGVYRMKPTVAIANRARYTPSFGKEYKNSQFLKNEMYTVLGDIFKENDEYKALPFVDLRHNRIYNILDAAAKAYGIDPYNLIHNCFKNENYLTFGKNKRMLLELFNHMEQEIVNDPEEFFKYLGVDSNEAMLNYLNFTQLLNNINENTFDYIKDTNYLKDQIKCMIAFNLFSDKSIFKKFDLDPTEIPEQLKKSTNLIKLTDIRNTYNNSLDLMDNIRSLFISLNPDGSFNYNIEGFKNYLKNHPEYYLAYMNNEGMITRLNTYNDNILMQVLSDQESSYSIISKDSFIGITNKIQPIKIKNPIIKFLHNELLRPLKILSLSNLNFILQNTIAAVFQNTISTGSGINFVKTITNMFKTNKDINDYKNLVTNIISSDTTYKFIGGDTNQLERCLDLIKDPDYIEALRKNGENELADLLDSLTDDDVLSLKELDLYMHSTSAEGEITATIERDARDTEIRNQANKAKIKLQDKYGDDIVNKIANTNEAFKSDEIDAIIRKNNPNISDIDLIEKREEFLDLQSRIKENKYQTMDIDKLIELRDNLLQLQDYYKEHGATLSWREQRQLHVIEHVINTRRSGITDKLTKMKLIEQWLNLNEHLETVFRVSAIRGYIEDGMSFEEATSEVIKRHFIYNNKSIAEQYAEFLIPFISYPLRMLSLVESMTHDATTMDLLYRFNKFSWGDEDASKSDYLTKRKARGDIPVGNKLLQLTSPFNEGIMNLQNPLYTLNNKINPLLKPLVDSISGSQYNRWNQIPVVSNVNNLTQAINEGNILHNITSDYYRYNSYSNYYLPRVNNRIGGTVYNKMYTKRGFSRTIMNMQPLNTSNLRYRVDNIMKYSGPRR